MSWPDLVKTANRQRSCEYPAQMEYSDEEPPLESEDERGDDAPLGIGSSSIPTSPLFRPTNLRCVKTLSGHHSGIRAVAVQPRTNRVFTGSYDNTIKVWNLDDGSCEATLEGHVAWIRSLFCHEHEPLLFSGSDDGEIKVWREQHHNDSYALTGGIQANAGGILAITVDYEREWLLCGCYDSSIQVYALPGCDLLHILPGHRSAVRCLTIYNGCLISGSYDRTVKLWDLNDECKCIGSLGTRGSVWALCVHDGMLIGAVGDSSIKVWRMDTWHQVTTLSGHRGLVLALACHGDRLISGSDDRCLRVWRLGSWECERTLTGHNGGVVGVCIVHGNCVSASNDSFIKVWNSTGIQRPFTAK